MNEMTRHNYTRSILIQMVVVLALLAIAVIWQREVIYQIYVANQVNAVGWVVNGGILLLFACGMLSLIKRFFEYRNQERAINRIKTNITSSQEVLLGIQQDNMIAARFLMLESLNTRRVQVNQNALAATLLATESSRNSFLKFVHNVLILTGVFGTIISLSMSLLGASDLLQSGGQVGNAQSSGLGVMIFGMSTALSTTLTAIIAYLFFGYFYIKLTDTQTFLISKIEEVTTTTLMPHLQLNQVKVNQDTVVKNLSDNLLQSTELIQKLDQSQKLYFDSAGSLEASTRKLADQVEAVGKQKENYNAEMLSLLNKVVEQQHRSAEEHAHTMKEVVALLERGFRIRSEENQ